VKTSPFNWRGQPSASGVSLMRGLKVTPVKPLDAPKRLFLIHDQPVKQQPGYGAFASA
jgi:hypothetical protein